MNIKVAAFTISETPGSFSILGGGGQSQRGQLQYLGGGGGYCKMYAHTHAHMYARMHMRVHGAKCSYTHAYMHMHAYIYTLNHDMKIIKIKASDLYENNIYTCNFSSSERSEPSEDKFWSLYYLKAI